MSERETPTGPNGSGRRHETDETLSAYLDGALADQRELARVRAHLAGCAECRRSLSELRALTALLRAQPLPEPPRSFRLTPEQVRRPAPPVPWPIRWQPALRRLTALAAVLLVVVVTSDLIVHGRAQPAASTQAITTSSGASSGGNATAVPALAATAAATAASAETKSVAAGARPEGTPEPFAARAAEASPAAAPAAVAATPAAAAGGASAPVSGQAIATATQPQAITPQPSETTAPSPAPSAAAADLRSSAGPPPQPEGGGRAAAAGGVSLWRPVELGLGAIVVISLLALLALPRLWAASGRR